VNIFRCIHDDVCIYIIYIYIIVYNGAPAVLNLSFDSAFFVVFSCARAVQDVEKSASA
jgi:hypothetical protein